MTIYEQIWHIFKKTYKKGSNFHNRDGSALKFIQQMTTIGAYIISKFQLCTSIISKVIAKSVLTGFFQDPCQIHKKHCNFYNIDGKPLQLITKVTTINTHIVSKFQICIPNMSEVITKSALRSLLPRPQSFQDHCTSIWVKISHMVFLSGTNRPSVHVWAILQFLLRPLSQFSTKTDYLAHLKTIAFSLFAPKWLQDI